MLLGGLRIGYGTHQQTCVGHDSLEMGMGNHCLYKANGHGPTNSLLGKFLGIVKVSFGYRFIPPTVYQKNGLFSRWLLSLH